MLSRGVAYMALSALGFSAMSVLVKLAAADLPTGEIVLARAAMTLVISYVMVKRANLSPWGKQRGKLLLRGFLGFSALACYYVALVRLPLADATTLYYVQPLLTAILAWRILGEPIGWATAFAIVCGIVGVLFVVHPGVGAVADPAGLVIALVSATLSSIAYVTVRQLTSPQRQPDGTMRSGEHPLVIVFYFPLVATPLSVPWAAMDFVVPSATDWIWLVAIGCTTQIGQVFLTKGLAIERAGRATSIGYVQICFAIVWQLVIFGQTPALGTVGGAALIIAGTLAVSATATRGAATPRTAT
ncbi:MAG: DMT family transporter [Kofleriaceae bacterium]|nr:DMT family transporter [Kofleriaceae bacterium]